MNNNKPLEAIIFAAGLGTRLAPITDTRPKALVPVCGKTMLQYAIENLQKVGVSKIVINIHHFPDLLTQFITRIQPQFADIQLLISDERDELLETGGGIRKALHLFDPDATIIAINADILTNLPLNQALKQHYQNRHDATLITKNRQSSRLLLFNSAGKLTGWKNLKSNFTRLCLNPEIIYSEAFCGYQILEYSLVEKFPLTKHSIINDYLRLASSSNIHKFTIDDTYFWFDIGSVDKLHQAETYLKTHKQ